MNTDTAQETSNKSENLVSQSEFARRCHVARQTISMAVRSSSVFTQGTTRKINLNNGVNAAYLKKCLHRKGIKDVADEIIEGREAEGILVNPPPRVEHKKDINYEDRTITIEERMQTRKLKAGVEKAEMELAKARGELVSRNDVALVFGKIHSVDTQEFHTLAQRAAPLIGAACGIEDPKDLIKITNILDKEVFKSLNHSQSHIDKFLEEHEER